MDAVAKLNYSHDAMIDLILANPSITQEELARKFGYTQGWVSRVMASDAFKAMLAKRRTELVDPLVAHSIEQQLEGLARRSLEVVMSKLDANPTLDGGLKALEVSSRALGYGARDRGPSVAMQFVVNIPPKAADPDQWLASNAKVIEG